MAGGSPHGSSRRAPAGRRQAARDERHCRRRRPGEGGILALAALARRHSRPGGRRFKLVMILGVLGACLFYGDSVITPAVSVLSAVEGLSVPAPGLAHYEVPLAMLVITVLFLGQRYGTSRVGILFGPVMVVWFTTLAVLGVVNVGHDPAILKAVSPTYAIAFVVADPIVAFIAMGAVVLSITGAEALYADMGHFGAMPIRRAWFFLVMPALLANYMGQGALILDHPDAAKNSFFLLAPEWFRLPLVALATLATVIASQSVISGAFSVSRQAERLGYLPRLTVKHTSERTEGQIYVPGINWILYVGVMVLLLAFPASEKLATAYGLAVTGTFILTTVLFLVYADAAWGWSRTKLLLVALPLAWLEGTYFLANLAKLFHGGWLPLVIAAAVGTIMFTWQAGRIIVTRKRLALEGPMPEFVEWAERQHLTNVEGTAVFLHPTTETAPLALRENALVNHILHERIFIVATVPEDVPHVPLEHQVTMDHHEGHITHLTVHFGFSDDEDIPAALAAAQRGGLDIDAENAFYFVSRISVHRGGDSRMAGWRKAIFLGLTHNAADPTAYFRLPEARTVVLGSRVLI
ncbi:MAG: KUP/HAK/KT family potassium transporter [Austwickia sp.]|nr:MAG: KUP/HAK/KT family potassium transporter [Austwickia sp.]